MGQDDRQQDRSGDAILTQLKAIVWAVVDEPDRELVDVGSITTETELASLPLDSLATIELMYSIEETFNISVTEDQTFELRTVGNVVEFIQEKQPSRAVG